MGSQNGKCLTPKVLAARPNLREWWVGEKNCCSNNVGNDSIVDRSLAKTETTRIRFASSGGKFEFYLGHGVPAMQENSVDPENPEAVVNENLQ